ncbi:MAG: alpha/beta hydrolase [Chitinophagaceae bacterium]
MQKILLMLFVSAFVHTLQAQVRYPFPLQRFVFQVEGKTSYMSYMDVQPVNGNGKTILLLHGKNFSGYYWKEVIPVLQARGYRVIVPDLPGFGRSGKPDLHYSFHMLSAINKSLLDSLNIGQVIVIGHSMGGMLAIRFTLLFPAVTDKLILENPIGLEDYKTFIPYKTLDQLYAKEKSATYESYKKYQQSYYPEWKSVYEQYVAAQAEALSDPGFDSIARVNAITYQMIYEQPVIYELKRITQPVLFIIGQADRTVVGKDLLAEDQKKRFGQYPQLGKEAAARIKNAKLIELPGLGHIPHVQDFPAFTKALLSFL